MDPEPFYHAGQYMGTLVEAEDGSLVVVSDDGQVLAAATADGQALDVADFAVDGNDSPVGEHVPSPEPEFVDEPPPEPDADQLEGAIETQLGAGAMALEHRLGRPLTNAERTGVNDVLIAQLEGGGNLDPFTSFDVHHELAGTTPPDLDNDEDRVRYMTERFEDMGRDHAEPVTPEDIAEIDTDTTDGLTELMTHQLNGEAPLSDGRYVGEPPDTAA